MCEPCSAVGFELWQVKSGTIFDDIIVTDSLAEAEAFEDATFDAEKDAEKKLYDAIQAVSHLEWGGPQALITLTWRCLQEKKEKEEAERKEAEEKRKAEEAAKAESNDEDDEDDDDEL